MLKVHNPGSVNLEEAADLFSLLRNPSTVRILHLLVRSGYALTVSALENSLLLDQQTISRLMSPLQKLKVLNHEKGPWVYKYFYLNQPYQDLMTAWLSPVYEDAQLTSDFNFFKLQIAEGKLVHQRENALHAAAS